LHHCGFYLAYFAFFAILLYIWAERTIPKGKSAESRKHIESSVVVQTLDESVTDASIKLGDHFGN